VATHRSQGLTPAPRGSLLQRVRALPSAVLLGVQLLGILVYPFTTESSAGRTFFSLFQLVVLGLAVAAVRLTPALTWVSVCIGSPAVILTILTAAVPGNDPLALASDVTHALFYFYTAYALIRYMFADTYVSRDELFATGACFTVVAWGFAYAYDIVQLIWGTGQFASGQHGELRWVELLFLSFTTMTNTGLSDIAPGGGHARSVMMLEQLAGLNYVALVVARLMGLTLARFQHTREAADRGENDQ